MAEAVRELREALELRFPDAMPIARGLAPTVGTGVAELDRVLGGGLVPGSAVTQMSGKASLP